MAMEMKEEKSLGDLFADLTRESSALIRQEINLAKAEMSAKAAKFGKDATTVAIGGFVAYAGALTLFASLVLVLVDFLNLAPSLAAFLVAVIALVGGGVMAMGGLKAMKEIDPTPHNTLDTLKEDAKWAKQQL